MNYKKPFKRSAIALAVSSATLMAGGFSSSAFAQDQVEDVSVEEIIVTGSRIRRPDYFSNSPVASVNREQITLTGTVNTESLLNTLPQVIPGLDRTSNNPGNGTATADLRGLGTTRTLVLINGRRANPTTRSGVVDINTIPNSLIENVEVVTGGASAVYGSDAIAGVVNFQLKDDFVGSEVSASYETTEEGDATLFSADVTLGADFDGGRGNAVINFSHTDRDDLFQGDRDFAFFAQFDDTDANGNPILIDGGSSGIPQTSIFAGGLGGFSPSFGIVFNQDGSIRPFRTSGDNDFYNYAPVNYIQLPQERNQVTTLINYELTDSVEAYTNFFLTTSEVPQQLAPTPIFQTTTFTLDGNPFITPDAQAVLSAAIGDGVDANGNGISDTATALLRRRLEEVGPRVAQSDYTSYTATIGFKGEIGNSDWTYDAYYQTGNSKLDLTQLGNVNRARFTQALNLTPDGTACSNPATNGATVGCSPLNIFGEGNISPQAAAFLRTAVTAIGEFDQDIAALNFSGAIGEIGLAAGFEYRSNEFDFRPSQDLASGTIAGFNAQPPSSGRFSVNEIYGEALIPLIKDKQWAQDVSIGLAARYSDYSTIGGVSTYKLDGSWEVSDSLRFRGGYNVAIRAPNINELFAPFSEGFPSGVDPCAGESAPVSPDVAAICAATGVPQNVIGSPAINPAAGQVRALGGGNVNLEEEEATTFTFGFVANPMDNLTLSVDYFNIEIEDYITSFGGTANNVLATCYDPTNPAGGVGSDFCNVITRRPDGTILSIALQSQNVASQTLDGFDVSARYTRDLFGGEATVRYLGTFTGESVFTAFDGAEPRDCAGRFGQDLCGEPVPEYKHRVTFGWQGDKLNAQLLWRHVGGTDDDNDDVTYFVESLDSFNYFDASGTYRFNDNYALTFGIDNLFDEQPPIIGDNQAQANTYPSTYDVFGRTYYLKFQANFGN